MQGRQGKFEPGKAQYSTLLYHVSQLFKQKISGVLPLGNVQKEAHSKITGHLFLILEDCKQTNIQTQPNIES